MSKPVFWSVVAVMVALDRLSKWAVSTSIDPATSVSLVPGFASLVHVRNPGAAFGMLATADPLMRSAFFALITTAVVATLAVLFMRDRLSGTLECAAAAAIIGGALGNAWDRLTLGEVIDFIDLYAGPWHWPAFNLADSFITLGALAFVLASFMGRRGVESA